MKLLHIDSAITGDASVSRQLSAAAVDRLVQADPSLSVLYRDLAADPLTHLTLEAMPSDLAEAGSPSAASRRLLEDFLDADVVVIGAPMYNFTISSQLKAWLDRILIAGKTFRYGPDGPIGLAGDKRVILALSRGGVYRPGEPESQFEHAESYLRTVFGFIGISPETVVAEGIAIGAEQRAAGIDSGLAAAAQLRAA